MKQLTIKVPCKVNLFLDITGVLENGYHEICSVLQTIDICDYITITTLGSKEVEVKTSNLVLADQKDNIAYKAAKLFCENFNIPFENLLIEIDKNISVEAGLGGGSANAAGVLIGLNEFYRTKASKTKLMEIGVKIGADVPFCIMGGTALAEGIGEKLTRLEDFSATNGYLVVVKPDQGVSTKEAYSKYDNNKFEPQPVKDILFGISTLSLENTANAVYNIFEELIELKTTSKIKDLMFNNGAITAALSGSGSSVFGLFKTKHTAEKCEKALKKTYEKTSLASMVSTGPVII